MRALILAPLALVAACSQAPEAANSAAVNEAATQAQPASGPVTTEEKSPSTLYADATAAYNSFERAAGMIGKERGSSAAVRGYADMLYKEHGQFGMKLKLASGKVPGLMPNPTLSPEQAAELTALQQASGAAFDRLFMRRQLAIHAAMLPVQQGYAAKGDEPALRDFADEYSRWVQRHLRMGKEV
jgi:putative membrane protein